MSRKKVTELKLITFLETFEENDFELQETFNELGGKAKLGFDLIRAYQIVTAQYTTQTIARAIDHVVFDTMEIHELSKDDLRTVNKLIKRSKEKLAVESKKKNERKEKLVATNYEYREKIELLEDRIETLEDQIEELEDDLYAVECELEVSEKSVSKLRKRMRKLK